MILGVTGSFGSGKSTVSEMFSRLGYKIIDADKIARKVSQMPSIKRALVKEFGTSNRKELAAIVFANSKKLKKLNSIVLPVIIIEIKNKIRKHKNVVLDAPLLIESGLHKIADFTIVVKCQRSKQIKRLRLKPSFRKISDKEIDNRIDSQLPLEKKLRYADYVIDNNSTLSKTRKKVMLVLEHAKRSHLLRGV